MGDLVMHCDLHAALAVFPLKDQREHLVVSPCHLHDGLGELPFPHDDVLSFLGIYVSTCLDPIQDVLAMVL